MLKRLVAVLAAVAVYYAIQFPSAWAGLQNPWGAPPDWVANGAWLYMTVHHLAQMVLALALIAVLSGFRFADWGLNLRQARVSLAWVKGFALWFGLFTAISFFGQLATGTPSLYRRPLEVDHVLGTLFFMWVVSGLSEEILFRGLMQTWLARFYQGVLKLGALVLPVAGLVTAVIFALVHVTFRIEGGAVSIVHLSIPQLVLAFVLGVFYAAAYHRTGSLLAPILAHNLSNGLMKSADVALAWLQAG